MGMGIGMMGYGLSMMIFGLIALIAIVAGTVWAVIHFTSGGAAPGTGSPHAREILDQRYARGEIDHEEYQRIRRELGPT